MFLFCGLGNPGKEYTNSFHNIGFAILDSFTASFENKKKLFSQISQINIQSEKIILQKPQTFMNDSGKAVSKTAQYFKIPTNQIVIIHDDADVDFGQVRLGINSGSAGHLGVSSVIESLGTQNFIRLRIGTGRPQKKQKTKEFILHKFSISQQKQIPKLIQKCKTALWLLAEKGLETAMTSYNKKNILN